MVSVITGGERELPADTLITASANELLLDGTKVAELWPETVASSPFLLEQIEQHNEQIAALHDILSAVPDPTLSLEQALALELVNPTQIEVLYRNLAEVLLSDDGGRLVLYLPFSFIPRADWQPENEELASAIIFFVSSYLFAWQKQLSVQDVRANFVDGDVLETAQRESDLPRVVKAAHLIPELLSHGLITIDTVRELYDSSADPILRRSISEAMVVIRNDLSDMPQTNTATIEPLRPTRRRQIWLNEKKHNELIGDLSQQFSQLILRYADNLDELPIELLINNSHVTREVFIEGIQKAVEQASIDGSADTMMLFDYFRGELLRLWHTASSPNEKERIATLLRHFHKLDLVSQTELESLGILLPRLSGDLSKNLALVPEMTKQVEDVIKAIETDPILASVIYPILSVGGSRLKGYGATTSDFDTGVFIRPDASINDGPQIRKLLAEHFKKAGLHDQPFEFWLAESDDTLSVRDIDDPDAVIANKYWTHILFGSAMVGNSQEIKELRKKLLLPYFSQTNETSKGRSNRLLFLERMEQDLLQYRLMHKGYERHYPRVKNIDTRHNPIDGQSIFWDEGYRRLATQLFIEKVFLPKIS